MNSRIALLGLSFACLGCMGTAHAQDAPAAEKPFFNWSDNSLTLLPYGWGFEVDPDEQSTFTYEHVHDSRIGDLFMFVDFVKFHGAPNGADDSAWYG